ncbi:Poliovirus receptor-related protein 4 [Platysternon megacephalum]|uniref:Poliovirus receptor-related protein 4 n=1 Tax=Platysternon megacephalum TaxID=55544 RepID=A0A4D9DKD5_9SAUR|nr:Poliovirus receptor-related protein 4 [Platysternon megacephalum]
MENQSSISDLLVRALDNLPQEDFKRFKDKLSHSDFKGNGNIPWGQLENADKIDTKNLLMKFYGAEAAVDVTIDVFTLISLRDDAAKLRERKKDLVIFAGANQKQCVRAISSDILNKALENLLAEKFDRFKYGLTCIECDGGRKIPKCRLEEANTLMKLVDFMCSYYCEDVAVKTAICALELMKMRDAAANLREKKAKDEKQSSCKQAQGPMTFLWGRKSFSLVGSFYLGVGDELGFSGRLCLGIEKTEQISGGLPAIVSNSCLANENPE